MPHPTPFTIALRTLIALLMLGLQACAASQDGSANPGLGGADAATDDATEGTVEADAVGTTNACLSDAECTSILGTLASCVVAFCELSTGTCIEAEAPGGTSCDDGDICTQGDVCLAGECLSGALLVCEDDTPCTDDSCDPILGCQHSFNTLPCDDGDACTDNDACVEGECMSGEPKTCDDANACTDDTCDPLSGCIFPPVAGKSCNDSNACTVGDQCSATGVCLPQSSLDCDDANPCTDDSCSATQGCLHLANTEACDDGDVCTTNDLCIQSVCSGTQNDCDDQDPCTVDSCPSGVGCQHLVYEGPCDDSDPCTSNDSCFGGVCAGVEENCEDNNPCTLDFCHPFNGCQSTPLVGTQCDDGDACTLLDSCTAEGLCQPEGSAECDDGNPCTIDSCDPLLGCQNVNLEGPCDDGDACTLSDLCMEGQCTGTPQSCDDDNVCTTDVCISDSGCVFSNNTNNCDDGDACTFNDTCIAGLCVGLTDSCDDDNPCTTDACAADATCTYEVITGPCDDGDACTVGDSCIDALCVSGQEVACDDNDACTIDLCDNLSGCSHTTVPSCLPPTAWPIINEFDYEQSGEDHADFVELVVVGEQTVELSSYQLELIDGTTGQSYDVIQLVNGAEQLHPGERLLIGPSDMIEPFIGSVGTLEVASDFLQNGGVDGDAIRLVRNTPAGTELVDSVSYEHPVPGANEGDSHVGFDSEFGADATSFARCAEALDTNMNSFDFVLGPPSPGIANPCDDDTP